ncbi:MAG: sigma-70 family RNA polymerase sigma factor [Cyanobacteria bacterium J06621_11]
MRSRTDLVDVFSTFVQFSDDRFETWACDLRLVKSMNRLLTESAGYCGNDKQADKCTDGTAPSTNSGMTLPDIAKFNVSSDRSDDAWASDAWARYWHQAWCQGTHSYAQSHLAAYLQESCYWAALDVTERFTSIQFTLADGFQIAITCLEKILKGYRPGYGSRLAVYARTAFGNFLRDRMRQQKVIHICSDWGLLRKLSQTQLKESLLAAGFVELASPLLVWRCFKAVCIPDPRRTVRTLPPPTERQLIALAERYNRLRSQVSSALPKIETQAVSTVLSQLVQAARTYLNPKITSLNDPQYDGSGNEILNELRVSERHTPMAQLLAVESLAQQKAQQQQIGAVLLSAITNFDARQQTLLHLYYHARLTQSEIAFELNLKQYQVSRQLSRIRQQLLLSVATWGQQHLHISIDPAVLANVSDVIDEWLRQHYGVSHR